MSLKISWKTYASRWTRWLGASVAGIMAIPFGQALVTVGDSLGMQFERDRRTVKALAELWEGFHVPTKEIDLTTKSLVVWDRGHNPCNGFVVDTTEFDRVNKACKMGMSFVRGLGYCTIVTGGALILIVARYNDKKLATYTALKEIKKTLPIKKEIPCC